MSKSKYFYDPTFIAQSAGYLQSNSGDIKRFNSTDNSMNMNENLAKQPLLQSPSPNTYTKFSNISEWTRIKK